MMKRHKPELRSDVGVRQKRKRAPRPPNGTAAGLLSLVGAWSHMSPEEIEQIKRDIFSSRRSST